MQKKCSVLQPIAKLELSVIEYLDNAISANTRKAYKADIAHFREWGGSIPSSPDVIVSYLSAHASSLAMATLTRRLAAISKAHTLQGFMSPVSSDVVRMTMRGIRRVHGRPQRQVSPLVKEDLIIVHAAIQDDLRGLRDKAVLLVGFCSALRRSEICQIMFEHLEFTSDGLVLTVPRSKTDQTGQGRRIGIPYGRGKICPVRAMQAWLDVSGIKAGAVFRAIERGAVGISGLSDRSIADIIKRRVAQAGFAVERFSGHSLRAGLATSAAQHGISTIKIREQTGHKSDAMLVRYIRDGNLFRDNAAALF